MNAAAQTAAPLVPPPPEWERPEDPDLSHLVTEDDTPLDNHFSEKQMHLLTDALYATWRKTTSRPFVAMTNVGLFYALHEPAIVPDVLVSMDVTDLAAFEPAPVIGPGPKKLRSYLIWEYGKAPEIVIEIVSNKVGNEAGEKKDRYAKIGVRYYVVFDPQHHVQSEDLRSFVLHGTEYRELAEPQFAGTDLGLTLWAGVYRDYPATYLRWVDPRGNLILTGEEAAEKERNRADAEAARANAEAARAEREAARANEAEEAVARLMARLRASEGSGG